MRHLAYRPKLHPILQFFFVLVLMAPWIVGQLWTAPKVQAVVAGDGLTLKIFSIPTQVTAPERVTSAAGSVTECRSATTVDTIDFDWGALAPTVNSSAGTCGTNDFMVYVHGYLTVPGTYTGSGTTSVTFYDRTSDGFYLQLDDPLAPSTSRIMDDWVRDPTPPSDPSSASSSQSFTLRTGMTYELSAWSFDRAGPAMMQLLWDIGGSAVIVPKAQLSTSRPLTPQPTGADVLTVHSTPDTLTYVGGASIGYTPGHPETSTLSATGSSDATGALTYNKVSGPCTLSGTTITATNSGSCIVTVTKAADATFAEATSEQLVIPILHLQNDLAITGNPTMKYAETQNLSTTGGSIVLGDVTYTVESGPCTVSGRVLSSNVTLDANPANNVCKISAVMAGDATYEAVPTTSDFSVTVSKQNQDAISGDALTVVASPTSLTYDPSSPPTSLVTASNGKGTGTVTFAVTSGPCTVPNTTGTSKTVTMTGKGTCKVAATKAADLNYLSFTSAQATISIAPATQSAVTLAASKTALTFAPGVAKTATLTASGGSGSGSYSFEVDAPHASVCEVASTGATTATLTAKSSGQCFVTAKRAADAQYAEQTSSAVNFTVATPVSVTVEYPSVALTYGVYQSPFVPIVATGGVNTRYYAPSKPSSVGYLPAGLTLNATTGEISGTPSAGSVTTNYTIVAEDDNGISASATFAISVAQATPSLTWDRTPVGTVNYGEAVADLEASATGTTSPVRYSIDVDASAICEVNATTGVLTVKRAGECNYRATVTSDGNYSERSITGNFLIAPATPSRPTNISGSVSDQDLTISWDNPTNDGGSAISSSTVTATSSGVTQTCVSSSSTCTFKNLNFGATYSVSMTVTNSGVAGFSSRTSQATTAKLFTIPSSSSRFANGTISDRYDPIPPTSVVDSLSDSVQRKLLDAGIVKAPSNAPSITIVANLSQTSFSVPVYLSIPQTIDSGTEVNIVVLPPTDTPVGTYVLVSIQVPGGDVIDLGTTSLTADMISNGTNLKPFALVPTGNYTIAVSLAQRTSGARAFAIGADQQTINYKVKVVSGSAGIPTIGNAPEPTLEPTETPEPTPEPSITESVEPSVEPSAEPSIDERGLVVVDPLAEPAAVAATAVTAVTLVAAVSAAASAAAAVGGAASAAGGASGASGGASGGARGGATGSSGGASASGGGTSGAGSSGSGPDDGSDNLATVQTVDVEHESFEDLTENWGDALPIWGVPLLSALDQSSHNATVRVSRFSPLIAKLITDGAYTTAFAGVLSLLLPVSTIVLALVAIFQNDNLLLPPVASIFLAMVVIGVFDAGAGFLGMMVFAIGMGLVAGVHTAADFRMLAGLVVIGFGPALLASAFRGLRRPAATNAQMIWERIVDLGVAPFIAGWATSGMVSALPSLAGVELPIGDKADTVGLAVAGAMAIRVVLEEFTAQYFPARLNKIHPTEVPPPPVIQKVIALAMRAGVFYFVAGAFIGFNIYLLVGTIIFILPNYIGLLQDRFPNSPLLYQILPAGLPGLAWSLITASWTLAGLNYLVGETPTFAKLSFAVLPVTSALFAILAMIGREPGPDDTRWYQRDRLTWVYRIGGIAMLIYTMKLAGVL